MNSILSYLGHNWQRFGLERYGTPEQMTSLIVTPRFHASSHVVFLIMPQDRPRPVLVAKVPRLAGEGETLVREIANLRAVQDSRDGGFDSVPRVVAFEQQWDRPILIETALAGAPLDPPTVRSDSAAACRLVVDWLVEIQNATRTAPEARDDWFQRLVAQPLTYLEENIALTAAERDRLLRTREMVAPLATLDLPLVVEHGDLSHPNLMLRTNGDQTPPGIGVVDWELADLQGLPGCDLFFFLTYVTFALHKSRENGRHVEAFRNAFFGPQSWVNPYVRQYAERVHLPAQALTPLFVLTWVRYLAGLLIRLDAAEPADAIDGRTATWLRQNRYYALWQYTLEHLDNIDWYRKHQ